MLLHIIVIYFLNYVTCNITSAPQTQISQGILRGQYLKTRCNRTISAFTGIPYAEPPVGVLRFELARPPKPWNGIWNATQPHSACPQLYDVPGGGTAVRGDEDCLYLNVYTPQLEFQDDKTSHLLPVIIFIHGGAFFFGEANRMQYNPTNLLDKDIVLVIPNYRLGPLGFLSTGNAISPGNNGLKDQNLALKWVKANIAAFGGNPDRITLAGQSAGGVSTHLHMLSPLSKDLIKGVISQSGTAFSVWGTHQNNDTVENTLKLAALFNCSTKISTEIVKCLKKVDANEITKKQHELYEWHFDPTMPFRPVVERGIQGAFLPEHPSEIIKSGNAAKIPFMTGITTEDGCSRSPGIFGQPEILKDFNNDFDKAAPLVFLYHKTLPDPAYVSTKIKSYYFKNQTLTNSSSSKDALTKVLTDRYFLSGTNDAVRLHINFTKQPVYYYAFGYRGPISYSELYGDSSYNYGVCHTDELLYLFDPKGFFPNYKPTSTDEKIIEILTTLWVNFAITGNPTTVSSEWEPTQSENLEYYFIKNATYLKMEEKLYWDRVQFWESLPIN